MIMESQIKEIREGTFLVITIITVAKNVQTMVATQSPQTNSFIH